jgi:hypothetical protein
MSRRKRNPKDSGWNDIDGGSAFVIPYTTLRSPNFRRLTPYGHKLILDLACQYTGFNNGYLCASWSLMKDVGWGSPATLSKAVNECEHYGLLIRTQQGGLNKPNLHAFTWRRIDEIRGRPLDIGPSFKPMDSWKEDRPEFIWADGKRRSGERRGKHLVAA